MINRLLYIILIFLTSQLGLFGQINFGTTLHDDPVEGYTLLAPVTSKTTYLIDNCGRILHTWPGNSNTGLGVYLTENGQLLRTEKNVLGDISSGGSGGDIMLINWEGDIVWKYTLSNDSIQAHHDVQFLPSGNILAIVWEKIDYNQVIAAGRDPQTIAPSEVIWSEAILELKPVGSNDVEVVWEWHMWDHLIQDIDSNKPNYGIIEDHPERFNVNNNLSNKPDWLHFNGLDYNEQDDLIAITSRASSEIYIIDHSTSVEESRSSNGGNYNKGGDILFRWGNPAQYNQGDENDQVLFGCHAPEFVKINGKSSNELNVFNNGYDNINLQSQVLIIEFKDDTDNFALDSNGRFLPKEPIWHYESPEIFSLTTSGAQVIDDRILITVGNKGKIIEINDQKELKWTYQNPAGMTIKNQNDPLIRLNSLRLFKALKYPIDYPAFNDKIFISGDPIELNVDQLLCDISTSTTDVDENKIKIYPNPNSGIFHIQKEGLFNYKLTNSIGQILHQGNTRDDIKLELSNKGIYFLSIDNEEREIIIVQ